MAAWLSKKTYSESLAIQQIDDYIRPWARNPEWLYCIDFVAKRELSYSEEYTFRVRWSIPKPGQPIPKASASVYFTFKLLKNMPEDIPASVNIKYECNTQDSDSQRFAFQEGCLHRILEMKERSLRGQVF